MADALFLSRFTPSRTSPDVLERIFVQRGGLADDAEQRIAHGATGGSKPQLLFVGPRGCGKTHLMTLIFHRLNRKPQLKDRLRIAWLAEDETTTSFVKLLLRIHRALRSGYPEEFAEPNMQTMRQLDDSGRAQLLVRTIIEQLEERTLLVIVENLDDVFKGLESHGQKQWRALLQERPVIATLATSQQLFAGVSRREEPFFGFFHVEHLRPLSIEEAVQLLQRIAAEKKDQQLVGFLESREGRNRISAIHHLSGGNHRIYIVLSDFITRDTLDELVGPFEKMLDEMTPYYQARMAHLSPQQREIVEYLARSVYAAAVKDIAAGLMLPHTTVASQLKSLREVGYVRSDAVGREMRYELTEPLMRLCVEVKENNRGPVRLFVDFLRLWYSRGELNERLKVLPPHAVIEKECILRALGTMRRAEARPQQERERAKQQDFGAALDLLLEPFAQARRQLLQRPEGVPVTSKQREMLQEAIAAYETVIQRVGEAHELPLRERMANAMLSKGWTLSQLARSEEEMAVYDALIEQFGEAPESSLHEVVAKALYNKGVVLGQMQRPQEELAVYDELIMRFGQAPELPVQDPVAIAMLNKGAVLGQLGRPQDEIAAYETLLARFASAPELSLRETVATAMLYKGVTLKQMAKLPEAIAAFDALLEQFVKARQLSLRKHVASAMIYKGWTLDQMRNWQEAITVYDELIERFGHDKELSIRECMASAMLYKGIALGQTEKPREAIAVYDALIIAFKHAQRLALRTTVANAMLWKGLMFAELQESQEAIATYSLLIERFGRSQEPSLREQVAQAMSFKGAVLTELGRHEEALGVCAEALKLAPGDAVVLNGLACSLVPLGRHGEAVDAIEKAVAIDSKTGVFQYTRAEVLLSAQRWEDGYNQLSKSLAEHPLTANAAAPDFASMIGSILASTRDPSLWGQRVGRLVQVCHQADVLTHLGNGLVKSLRHIPSQMLNQEVLPIWRDVWHEFVDSLDDMRLPLRLFDIGIRYYETNKPEVLLDLVSEERSILAKALGLELNTIVQAGKGELA